MEARQLTSEFKHKIKTMVGISVGVEIVPPGFLPRSESKAQRVFDIRNSATA